MTVLYIYTDIVRNLWWFYRFFPYLLYLWNVSNVYRSFSNHFHTWYLHKECTDFQFLEQISESFYTKIYQISIKFGRQMELWPNIYLPYIVTIYSLHLYLHNLHTFLERLNDCSAGKKSLNLEEYICFKSCFFSIYLSLTYNTWSSHLSKYSWAPENLLWTFLEVLKMHNLLCISFRKVEWLDSNLMIIKVVFWCTFVFCLEDSVVCNCFFLVFNYFEFRSGDGCCFTYWI